MIHQLKTWPSYFREVQRGAKDFEFRRDDREPMFQEGDELELREFDPSIPKPNSANISDYTGRMIRAKVLSVWRGGVIPDGYCIMRIAPEIAPPEVAKTVEQVAIETVSWALSTANKQNFCIVKNTGLGPHNVPVDKEKVAELLINARMMARVFGDGEGG